MNMFSLTNRETLHTTGYHATEASWTHSGNEPRHFPGQARTKKATREMPVREESKEMDDTGPGKIPPRKAELANIGKADGTVITEETRDRYGEGTIRKFPRNKCHSLMCCVLGFFISLTCKRLAITESVSFF